MNKVIIALVSVPVRRCAHVRRSTFRVELQHVDGLLGSFRQGSYLRWALRSISRRLDASMPIRSKGSL